MTSTSGPTRTESQLSSPRCPCKVRLAGASCIPADPSVIYADPSVVEVDPSVVTVDPSVVDIGHHQRVDQWRIQLDEHVSRGRDAYGDASIREALEGVLASLTAETGAVPPLAPVVAVLGGCACAAGWVGVLVRPSGRTTLHVGATLSGLVEQVRDQETLGAVGLCVRHRQDEADAWLLTRPTVEVIEVVDPETNPDVLAEAGLTVPAMYSGMGFVEQELHAAGAAVIEAARLFS